MGTRKTADRSKKAESPKKERRVLVRYPCSAGALIIRESDFMRLGIDARVRNVSLGGLGLEAEEPLELNEQVKIQLRNDVQRFEKEVRGIVRHVTWLENGVIRIGIELLLRLTPLEVSMLRMGIKSEDGKDTTQWV